MSIMVNQIYIYIYIYMKSTNFQTQRSLFFCKKSAWEAIFFVFIDQSALKRLFIIIIIIYIRHDLICREKNWSIKNQK